MFYPGDEKELRSMCTVTPKEGHTPSLMLLPHAGLEYVAPMYQEAFSLIHNPKRIVILCPIHGERLEEDGRTSLFTLSPGDVESPLGPVHIESVPGVKVQDAYAEAEYSLELFYPYIALDSPASTVLPLFTALETKEDIQGLSRLMARLKKDENDSLFILCGNFTELGRSEEVNRMARTLNELLENNAPLLEAGSHHRISGCAYRLLEAARTAFPGSFRLVLARSGDYLGECISNEADGRIWASAWATRTYRFPST